MIHGWRWRVSRQIRRVRATNDPIVLLFPSTWSTCWRYVKLSLLPIYSMLLSRRLPSSGAALWVTLFVLPPLVSMIGITSYTLRYPLILRQVLYYQELSLYYRIMSRNAQRRLLFSSLLHCIPWTRRRRKSLSVFDWPGWRTMSLQDITQLSRCQQRYRSASLFCYLLEIVAATSGWIITSGHSSPLLAPHGRNSSREHVESLLENHTSPTWRRSSNRDS